MSILKKLIENNKFENISTFTEVSGIVRGFEEI